MDSVGDRKSHRFEFYFETEDILAAIQRVKASGAEFLHELHEEPWGQWTARIFDPDRNLIEIGESLETFVKRLHGSEMTLEQVAQKTSVPLMKVKDILRE
jgi:hypothetical protein